MATQMLATMVASGHNGNEEKETIALNAHNQTVCNTCNDTISKSGRTWHTNLVKQTLPHFDSSDISCISPERGLLTSGRCAHCGLLYIGLPGLPKMLNPGLSSLELSLKVKNK